MSEMRINPNTGEHMLLRSPVSLYSYVPENSRLSRSKSTVQHQSHNEAKLSSTHSSETTSSENATIPDAISKNFGKYGAKLNNTVNKEQLGTSQSQPTKTVTSYTPFHRKLAYSITDKSNQVPVRMKSVERPKKTVAFGLTTNIDSTLLKDKERDFSIQPTRSRVSSFLSNCQEIVEIKKEQSTHKSVLEELQNKVSELEANDVKQKNEIIVLQEKLVELCSIVTELAEPSSSPSPAPFCRFQAPAIVEKAIQVQKPDKRKEKPRRPNGGEGMNGNNSVNSKIKQHVSVERKVTYSSPNSNRVEEMRIRQTASATQTHMRNNFGGGGGLKQTNKNKNSRSKPIGSVHFDELSLSTAPPNGNTQQLRIYQLSDSSSESSYSD